DDFAIANTRTTQSDQPGVDSQHSTGAALRLEYTLPSALTLTTIASYADSPIKYSYDGDWGNPILWAPYIYESSEVQNRHRTTRNFELRLGANPASGPSWIVGVYALELRESLTDSIYNLYQDPTSQYFPPATDMVTTSEYRARSAALFGELDQDLGHSVRLSVGLRGEHRSVNYQDLLTSTGTVPLAREFGPTDQLWGGNVSLAWKPTAAQTVYGLVSRGYKAGGFNLSPGLPTNEPDFRPESDLNFEIGYKADVAEHRLRFDSTLFYTHR